MSHKAEGAIQSCMLWNIVIWRWENQEPGRNDRYRRGKKRQKKESVRVRKYKGIAWASERSSECIRHSGELVTYRREVSQLCLSAPEGWQPLSIGATTSSSILHADGGLFVLEPEYFPGEGAEARQPGLELVLEVCADSKRSRVVLRHCDQPFCTSHGVYLLCFCKLEFTAFVPSRFWSLYQIVIYTFLCFQLLPC